YYLIYFYWQVVPLNKKVYQLLRISFRKKRKLSLIFLTGKVFTTMLKTILFSIHIQRLLSFLIFRIIKHYLPICILSPEVFYVFPQGLNTLSHFCLPTLKKYYR